jgi:hypothetical protein
VPQPTTLPRALYVPALAKKKSIHASLSILKIEKVTDIIQL